MKSAIVTGGAQGIGRGTVQHLLDQGWRVGIFDADGEAVAEMRERLPQAPLFARTVDVGDESAVADAVAAWRGFAGDRLDLLVSNAGIADPYTGPIEDLALETWRKWQDSHLTGGFLMTRACVPLLRAAKGSIVFMASTRALQSEPQTEAYAAAKGGLCALTHALAISLGPDIRVNAILPGWIETRDWQKAGERQSVEHRPIDCEQHPVGRVGTPQDIAATVAFLASEGAGFITGQQFVVDGGMTRKMIYAD
ncbi:SDR family oxidoreductase [Sphingosinithalassobacter sp. CS137]|uniref:SDR family oxidoreductase n=1 Tax=Sphingosinithalassobacter sp. CS137 TaxID=2762748 RepID=UPI00165E50BF|nr:SDR family oxidoreductase [Sphingosinithalassobacter sp. CS137]